MKTPEEQLNQNWTNKKVIENAYIAGASHAKPSPGTLVKFEKLETNYENTIRMFEEHSKINRDEHEKIVSSVEKVTEALIALNLQMAGLPDKLDERFKKKFASKLTERIVFTMVGIILAAFMGALTFLTFK